MHFDERQMRPFEHTRKGAFPDTFWHRKLSVTQYNLWRAMGLRPDGAAWTIAMEAPDAARRTPHSVLALEDAAMAMSADTRRHVGMQGRRLLHRMDPRRGAPRIASPASVPVVARNCAEADGWATALMVLASEAGAVLASRRGLDALLLLRNDDGSARGVGVGRPFSEEPAAIASGEEG